MSNKFIALSMISVFWLLFPFMMMLIDEGGSNVIDTTWIEDLQNPSIFDIIVVGMQYLLNYFFILLVIIPNVSIYINLIVLAIKFISGVAFILIIRGN